MATVSQDLLDQIAHLEALIVAYRAAILAFATNGAAMKYKFNSGQQDITVEREDPKSMREAISSMMNEKQIMCQRAGLARGTVQTRGAW